MPNSLAIALYHKTKYNVEIYAGKHQVSSKKNQIKEIGWYTFDFSNSIVSVIGGIFFSKWFIEDTANGNVSYNILYLLSAILIIVTSGYVGRSIDIKGYPVWLKGTYVLNATVLIFLALTANIMDKNVVLSVCVYALFSIYLFGYQVSRICHNVYLRVEIAADRRERVSGYGVAANWLGAIFGILLTIPVTMHWDGAAGREATFVVGAISYAILTLMALRFMGVFEAQHQGGDSDVDAGSKFRLSQITAIIVIFFFIFEVMSTLQRNLAPFLSGLFVMNDQTQSAAFLIILVFAALGGVFAAIAVGAHNSKIWIAIPALTLGFALLTLAMGASTLAWWAFPFIGWSFGVLESSIRLTFMQGFSGAIAGRRFALLAAVERSSSIVGPVVWSSPFLLSDDNALALRWSMALMAATVAIAAGALIVRRRTA